MICVYNAILPVQAAINIDAGQLPVCCASFLSPADEVHATIDYSNALWGIPLLILSICAILLPLLSAPSFAGDTAAWTRREFQFRRPIHIDASQLTSDVCQFPLIIRLKPDEIDDMRVGIEQATLYPCESTVTLCDFASAGALGERYEGWIRAGTSGKQH